MIDSGKLDNTTLDAALEEQAQTGVRLGETLLRRHALRAVDVARALATQLGLPYIEAPLAPTPESLRLVRPTLARVHAVLPLAVTPRELRLAMADPLDLRAVDDLRFQTGRRIDPVVATPEAVSEALDTYYGSELPELVEALPSEILVSRTRDADELERATRAAPVVRLVDRMIKTAIDEGASDIHVEETGSDVRVRYRIDGKLKKAMELPSEVRRAVLSRLKVMAGMDISVRRRAQDGSIDLPHDGRTLNLRVSTLPVNGGEKAVVRILDPSAAPPNLAGLGFDMRDLKAIRELLLKGEGVVLVAGPTGSGKSTTIFSALSELDRDTRNIVTLEDPVEYRLPGANQIQVDRRAGLGFADALRAVLRQDPDVVMVGEIRDAETAEIAMTAAVTGHLVLSTIHTTDAPGAITRLLNMGVPPFLVAGGLSGIVAQRLIRRSCPTCRGRGCGLCGDGHQGRTGVFQVLTLTDPLRDAISRGEPTARIRALASEAGMGSLAADALRAVAAGHTTPHEIT
ncbi:MAG: type II secretion system protein GspE, partial [Proteobacteria bacterium]|nr:type II secretion system protein GspE [Pseudomonadota bacterium]